MASVIDVAAYILDSCGEMTAMKLQKLVYYSQAWSLVWDEAPLFDNRIEAWANGPVVPALYAAHRRQYSVSPGQLRGNPESLDNEQQATINAVLSYYGDKDTQWLVDLTHMEDPWLNARKGIPDNARANEEISQVHIAEYYSSLPPDKDAEET